MKENLSLETAVFSVIFGAASKEVLLQINFSGVFRLQSES